MISGFGRKWQKPPYSLTFKTKCCLLLIKTETSKASLICSLCGVLNAVWDEFLFDECREIILMKTETFREHREKANENREMEIRENTVRRMRELNANHAPEWKVKGIASYIEGPFERFAMAKLTFFPLIWSDSCCDRTQCKRRVDFGSFTLVRRESNGESFGIFILHFNADSLLVHESARLSSRSCRRRRARRSQTIPQFPQHFLSHCCSCLFMTGVDYYSRNDSVRFFVNWQKYIKVMFRLIFSLSVSIVSIYCVHVLAWYTVDCAIWSHRAHHHGTHVHTQFPFARRNDICEFLWLRCDMQLMQSLSHAFILRYFF